MSETETYLTHDAAYPFSEGALGLIGLLAVAGLLVALTLWTYLGDPQATRRRVWALVGLRLLALLIAILTVLRPSVAVEERPTEPSVLSIVIDASESMTVTDEVDDRSRWRAGVEALRRAEGLIEGLKGERDVRVEVFAFGPAGFDPEKSRYTDKAKPDAGRTDFAAMLTALAARYEVEPDEKRALVVLSDGIDNGPEAGAALAAAKRWARIAPIKAFALGRTTTSADRKDVAVTSLTLDPSPVPIKAELTARAVIDAPGFEGAKVRVRLFFDDKEVKTDEVPLAGTKDNVVALTVDAPDKPGEVKVTFKVDPLRDEAEKLNNQVETYLTVTKEGLTVLVIDRLRLELKYLRRALASEKRVRLYEAVRQTDAVPPGGAKALYELDRRAYDVIIIGDVSAGAAAAGDPQALAKIAEAVEGGAGLMMTGGLKSFRPGGWAGTPVGDLLPVRLTEGGQTDRPTKMVPTATGLRQYIMRLDPNAEANEAIWGRLNDPKNRALLNGRSKLGPLKVGAIDFARADDAASGEPILVGRTVGKGRVLAFAADSTWRWTRLGVPLRVGEEYRPDGLKYHQQFWKQVVLWLARQEETPGDAFVTPKFRRLPVRGKQELRMGLRGKTGQEIKGAEFTYKVVGPGQEPGDVKGVKVTAADRDADGKPLVRLQPLRAGEYRVSVTAAGEDADGETITAEAKARYLVYPDVSAEMARLAANHDFLAKLEEASDPGRPAGPVAPAETLSDYLEGLRDAPQKRLKARPSLTPDWRRGAMPWFLPTLLVVFVAVLGLEWGLRRSWGLV